MSLSYPVLAENARVREAASNPKRPLGFPESSDGVGRLQQTLIDVGYDLPITVRKSGRPDNIFGDETLRVVKQFQKDVGLKVDGLAGPDTLQALNDLAMKGVRPPPTPKPVPPLFIPPQPKPPVNPNPGPSPPAPNPPANPVPDPFNPFKLGTDKPTVPRDFGSGSWNSEPATLALRAKKQAIIQGIGIASVVIGPDAAKHMLHYLGNSGSLLTIDYKGLLESVDSANTVWVGNMDLAKEFCRGLPLGTHEIVSKETTAVYCHKRLSTNWFYAVGGFHCWGRGTVTIEGTPGQRRYRMMFHWFFDDRYNWDHGHGENKQVEIAGIVITDKFMGDFHRQGLAQEYNMSGSVSKLLEWTGP